MPGGVTALVANLGASELFLIILVAVPFMALPVIALLLVFRMGKRQGADEASRAMGAGELGRNQGADSRGPDSD